MAIRPRVAIVGVGGFARTHLSIVSAAAEKGLVEHVAQVAPPFDQKNLAEEVEALRRGDVAIYSSLRQLLAEGRRDLDLVTIPTGIPLHRAMTVACLEAGVNVMVEKPAAGSIQDVDAMIAARRRAGRMCAVAYQHVYQPLGRTVKEWVCQGKLGAVQSLSAFGCWPRAPEYYGRNGWAGRLAAGDTWVLDGPHNNALAHAMNFMLYVGSAAPRRALTPASLRAELYRANAIEAADTCFMRVATAEGPQVYFSVSHCTDRTVHPRFVLAAERGTVTIEYMNDLVVEWRDGRREEHHYEADHGDELQDVARALAGHQVGAACPLEVARAETLCACGSYESSAVNPLPQNLLSEGDKGAVVAAGMTELVVRGWEERALPSEMGVDWARPGKEISLARYDYFPTHRRLAL